MAAYILLSKLQLKKPEENLLGLSILLIEVELFQKEAIL